MLLVSVSCRCILLVHLDLGFAADMFAASVEL